MCDCPMLAGYVGAAPSCRLLPVLEKAHPPRMLTRSRLPAQYYEREYAELAACAVMQLILSLQGLWKSGKSHGPGRYKWKNRNEYDGEWKNGKMHGQGTLRWSSGERYDGEWRQGEEHGLGMFTWSDGSTYDGFWHHGKKHGIGVGGTHWLSPCIGNTLAACLASRLNTITAHFTACTHK